jgi:hypothetical protein
MSQKSEDKHASAQPILASRSEAMPLAGQLRQMRKQFSEGERVWLYKRTGKRGSRPGKYVCLECERKSRLD